MLDHIGFLVSDLARSRGTNRRAALVAGTQKIIGGGAHQGLADGVAVLLVDGKGAASGVSPSSPTGEYSPHAASASARARSAATAGRLAKLV